MPTVKFKVGMKDLETPEEKRLGWGVLMCMISTLGGYIPMMLLGRESWPFFFIAAGFLYCAYSKANRLCELYDARMDPTKELDDYE